MINQRSGNDGQLEKRKLTTPQEQAPPAAQDRRVRPVFDTKRPYLHEELNRDATSKISNPPRVATQVLITANPLKPATANAQSLRPVPNGYSAPAFRADYQGILLALADQYVAEAYRILSDEGAVGIMKYQRLVITAIACLESVLTNFRQLDPRKEGRIRLRLALLLTEETDNIAEVSP